MAVNESDDVNVSDRLCGIENLEKLIITMSRCENYIPTYYYASLSTLRAMEDIPNNIIVTEGSVFVFPEIWNTVFSTGIPGSAVFTEMFY